MNLPDDDIARVARLARLDAGTVRRILLGEAPAFLSRERVAHVEALARETLPRLPACRRVRVLSPEEAAL